MRHVRWACLLMVATQLVVAAQTTKPPHPATSSSNTVKIITNAVSYERIVLVGASVTAGFTESEPLGGPITRQLRLDRYVDAALLVPHAAVKNLGNAFFFLQPNFVGRQQIEQLPTHRPTLVIGLDFLFWFLYGEGRTDEERLQRFEQGLKLLEVVECPLVLGDIPDASMAVNGMLRPDQIPSADAMIAANRRLKEWGAGRPQVAVVKLSEFMRNALANRAIKFHHYTLTEGKTRSLLQNDMLHASPQGCAALALAALEAVQVARPASGEARTRRDPTEVHRLVSKSLKEAAGSAAPTTAPKSPPPNRTAPARP